MKTAISLPDALFAELGREAQRSKRSRSGIVAEAVREFLERRQTRQILERLNAVYGSDETVEDRALRLAAKNRAAQIISRDPL